MSAVIDTDRTRVKKQEAGVYVSSPLVGGATAAVSAIHSRQRDFLKTGAEVAATPVAESPICVVERASQLNRIKILPPTGGGTVQDAANILTYNFFKRDSTGANQVAIGSWSTLTGAQGTLTALTPATAALSQVAGALQIAAGSMITYSVTKGGTGAVSAPLTTFSLDLEEV